MGLTTSLSINVCASTLLPSRTMFLPGCAFSVRTSSTTLLLMIIELRHRDVSFKLVETTYFRMPFITSPNGSPAGIGSKAAP